MQNTAAAEPPAAEGTAADCPPQPGRLWSRVMSWSAWAILAGYIVVLVLRVQVKRRSVTHPAELTLGDLLRWRQLLAESLAAFVQTGLCFFLFGFLVAAAIGAAPAGRSAARGAVGWGTFLARWLLIGALGAGLWHRRSCAAMRADNVGNLRRCRRHRTVWPANRPEPITWEKRTDITSGSAGPAGWCS